MPKNVAPFKVHATLPLEKPLATPIKIFSFTTKKLHFFALKLASDFFPVRRHEIDKKVCVESRRVCCAVLTLERTG